MKVKNLKDYRVRRHLRLRRKVQGTAECPRMSVFVSNKHFYVQFIDDSAAKTLAAVSTISGELKGQKLNIETAKQLGSLAAKAAQDKGISQVVFDRGGFAYRGRLQALADAAREGGLKF
ncbi:MAG: 50S ribosomal protein L18 [Verrucomicrobiota bacterium]|jgi:large subunit ribosomal protein L18|nr:50S ribosomal protein L18 [Verrucomicrobiota bacterium]